MQGWGVKMQSFRMCSNLSCYQLKIDCYKYKLFYISIMVTTKQKLRGNTQKIKRKESSIPLQKSIKSQKKKAREEERDRGTTKQP